MTSGKTKYHGELIFDTNSLKLRQKNMSTSYKDGDRNFKWSYQTTYKEFNGFLFPSVCRMDYDIWLGKEVNFFIINEINMEKPKRVLFPIYELEKAPSNNRFWKNYNKMVQEDVGGVFLSN